MIAIEPDRVHENVFEGGDPLMAALEFAAAEIRKGSNGTSS